MKRVLIISCLLFLIVGCVASVDYIDFKEEVLIKNYWNKNYLNLTRKVQKSAYDEGYYVKIPDNLIVKNDEIYIFDHDKPIVVRVSSSGKLLETYDIEDTTLMAFEISDKMKLYLYSYVYKYVSEYDLPTSKTKKLFPINHIADLFYDEKEKTLYHFTNLYRKLYLYDSSGKILKELEIGKILKKTNEDYYTYENFVHESIIYSPVDDLDYEEKVLYTSALSKYDPKRNKISILKSKGGDFGFIIIGIDNRGNIFSTNDWLPSNILVHDRRGNFLLEITPDYDKYGTAEAGGRSTFAQITYITEEGEIYLMMRMEEGLFVIKYTLEFKK